MSFSKPEEYELLALARNLGGVAKIKALLQAMKDNNIAADALMLYLKSMNYKIPSSLERRVEELEKRLLALDGKTSYTQPGLPEKQSASQPKEWLYEDLKKGLDDAKEYHSFTFLYYKTLTNTKDKISREDLINKISKISGKKFSGYSLAGVLAGITASMTKHNYERWDSKDEDSQYFSLNEKYRKMIEKYFESQGGIKE